jgi:hypothetical protein
MVSRSRKVLTIVKITAGKVLTIAMTSAVSQVRAIQMNAKTSAARHLQDTLLCMAEVSAAEVSAKCCASSVLEKTL